MLDPKITVCYVAVSQGPISDQYASRFIGSWLENPPGVDCQLVVACNGGPLPAEIAMMFSPIACQFFPRQNDDGWDIAAFQDVATKFPCDMLVCFGESCYFHRPGWLLRMVEAWKKYGAGMYGFFSSHLARAHMNTTAFCVDPKFMLGYQKVTTHQQRYAFEHGLDALWRRMQRFGRPTRFVTWDGEWAPHQWRYPQNILWRGDQSNLLCRCNHTDRYDAADEETKNNWSEGADAPFK